MTSVLGLSPERATELLAKEGLLVTLEETRSKKGVEHASQNRVIRQSVKSDGSVLLVFSAFQTETMEQSNQR